MSAFTDALNGKVQKSTSTKTTPFQAALQKYTPPTPVNKFGQDVSTHTYNPFNPNNQINAPQPSTSLWQNFKSSVGPTIKQGLNKVYDMAGQLVAPGITHDELRNKQILKDTLTGLPKAAVQVGGQLLTHPLDSTVTAVRSATKGISDTITNGIINVFIPKADRAATQAQVQETLSKYLGSPEDYSSPGLKGIAQGFEASGQAAPAIYVGGKLTNALGAAGLSPKAAGLLGNAGGFVATGQTQIPLESTVKQRTNQAMNDLVALGLFEAGSTIFHGIKGKVETAIRASLKPGVEVVPDTVVHTTTGDKTFYTIPKDKATPIISKIDNSPAGYTAKTKTGDNLHVTAKTPEQMVAQGYKFGGAISEDSIVPPEVSSKVAKSIETKAIEKGFTDGFTEVAGYDPVTVKEQARIASELLTKDFERATRMVMGEEPLPSNLREASLLKAMEDYAFAKKDVRLIQDLANSPLAAATSVHAQELRLLAERTPDSPVSVLRDLKAQREAAFEKRTGQKPDAATKSTIKEIQSKVKPVDAKTWSEFIDSIKC